MNAIILLEMGTSFEREKKKIFKKIPKKKFSCELIVNKPFGLLKNPDCKPASIISTKLK